MKCGRVQLQERVKFSKNSCIPNTSEKPTRMCQRRLVDPAQDDDPRWLHVLQRFHCNTPEDLHTKESNNSQSQGDLYLSVQNLRFEGDEKQRKRPRTGFKYKGVTNGNTHRMFVKQVVPNVEPSDEDSSSQLTCYYYDDYAKYLSSCDMSRPSSGKSSVFCQGVVSKFKANKAVQVDTTKLKSKKTPKVELKRNISDTKGDFGSIEDIPEIPTDYTKVSFHESGKRRSLTISRIPSPETVQVIRVDVVCNYSNSSSLPNHEDKSKHTDVNEGKKSKATNSIWNPHFANRYFLTSSIKPLDENVSGGAKVTLLCKTFRLSDRSKVAPNKKASSFAK